MRNVQPAIDLIKRYEGLCLKAYKCPAGVWTIGYGTTRYHMAEPVREGDIISEAKAEELLAFDVMFFADRIEGLITAKVTDNEFCALLSFSYNVGYGALKSSTLLRKLNAGHDRKIVAEQFMRWVKAGGRELAGLVARRNAERALFLA